jgi:hypothetical protein
MNAYPDDVRQMVGGTWSRAAVTGGESVKAVQAAFRCAQSTHAGGSHPDQRTASAHEALKPVVAPHEQLLRKSYVASLVNHKARRGVSFSEANAPMQCAVSVMRSDLPADPVGLRLANEGNPDSGRWRRR